VFVLIWLLSRLENNSLFTEAKTEEYSREMFKLLESRNYPNLNFRGKILDDETHFTMVSSIIGKGLKSVFNQ